MSIDPVATLLSLLTTFGIAAMIASASNFGWKIIEAPANSSTLIATNRPCV